MRIAYILFAATSLILRGIGVVRSRSPRVSSSFPFTGAILNLVQCIEQSSVPVYYMLFPPTISEREQLSQVDERGVTRPVKSPSRVPLNGILWTDILDLLIIYLCDWS